jgi:hypothetical protein
LSLDRQLRHKTLKEHFSEVTENGLQRGLSLVCLSWFVALTSLFYHLKDVLIGCHWVNRPLHHILILALDKSE